MSQEILINVTPRETRAAILENGVLNEVFIEREKRRGIVGNIYKGKVQRVLPGMQAAFVDIGLERAAFLHASDIVSSDEALEEETPKTVPAISELLTDGQEVLVQVTKDPLGTKGARLTTNLTIPSRFLVYMPDSPSIGVSTRIEDEAERQRLRDAMAELLEKDPDEGGFILRTVAEGASKTELAKDRRFLNRLWKSVQERMPEIAVGTAVHEDLPLGRRTLRDYVGDEVDKIRVDSRETYHKLKEFAERFLPELTDRIEHYPGERPIFDLYSVENEIQKSLDRKVELKSGGYLIIDQTEAMTTVDVNTGAFVGHKTLEETIFKTNLEATQAIARQLRLRNLGGIIILDFIDMEEEEHKRQVLRSLEKALEKDHSKTQISEVSALGLVQMTRKRTRESLERILCESCAYCQGRGTVKTSETVVYEIFREIIREARQYADAKQLRVLAGQEVIDVMLDDESASLAELESFIKKPIKLQVEVSYTQEQYDVVLL